MVERSREIFEKNGILGEADTKNDENIKLYKIFMHNNKYFHTARSLSEDVIRCVESFHQDDEYSRRMPDIKDYVSIKKNVHVQKRLILSNLRELHAYFMRIYQYMKVGLTH